MHRTRLWYAKRKCRFSIALDCRQSESVKDSFGFESQSRRKVDALNNEEKALKKKIKEESNALHLKIKTTIENLSDDAVLELLRKKWILPLVISLRSLPDTVIADFISRLEAICKRYETTFAEVEEEIADTERSLISLLDDLTGNEFDMMGLAELKKCWGR